MKLKKWASWWQWLVNPKMAVLYALLLPLGLNVVGGVFSELFYSIDFLQQDGFVQGSWFLEICMQTTLELLGILLLANIALGKRKQPVPSLLYRSWLWTAAAALLCIGLSRLAGGLSGLFQTLFSWQHFTLALLKLAAMLLLTLLLCGGEEGRPKLSWHRSSIILLVTAVLLPLLFNLADWQVNVWQLAQRELEEVKNPLFSFRVYGLGHDVWQFFNCLNALTLVGLCYTLAGGRLFPRPDPATLGEPLPMSPQAEQGQRALGRLLKIWFALLVAQYIISFLVGEGLGLDIICLNGCLTIFLYYGRRWARVVWYILAAFGAVLLLPLVAMLLWAGGPKTGMVVLLGLLLAAPITAVNIRIIVRLLRENDPIHLYIQHCKVSPPTPSQLKWERRASVSFWVVVVVSTVLVASYWMLLRFARNSGF